MARVFPSLLTQIGDPSSSRLPSLVALQRADVVVGAAFDALKRAAQSNELVPPWALDVELYSPLHEGGFGVIKPPQRVHAKAFLSEDWMSFRSSLAPGEQDWLDSLTFGQLGLKFLRTIPSHPRVRLTTEEYHVASRWFFEHPSPYWVKSNDVRIVSHTLICWVSTSLLAEVAAGRVVETTTPTSITACVMSWREWLRLLSP